MPSPPSSEPGCRFDSLDEVPREDQHVTGESEDFYEVAEDDAGEEHDDTYQDEGDCIEFQEYVKCLVKNWRPSLIKFFFHN